MSDRRSPPQSILFVIEIFIFSSSDKSVKIWDAGSRQCVHTFYEHKDQVIGNESYRRANKQICRDDCDAVL